VPIRRRNPKSKVIIAGIQGLIIGAVGVLLFGFILNLSNDEKVVSEGGTAETPATEGGKVEVSAEPKLTFKAKQYGMFTSKESALDFMGDQPGIADASIVQAGEQFFVWTELFVSEVNSAQSDALPSFTKTLYVSTSGCEDPKVTKLFNSLQKENISKNYFDTLEKKEEYPDDLATIVQAVSVFSDKPSIMRLHLMTHYLEKNTCAKLSF
jgi:hypothetical protein